MTSTKILRIKNSVLIALAAAYCIFCKIVSRPLLTFSDTHWAQPREAGAYIKSNLVYVAVFVLFMSFAVTSFLLAYLIYCRFDRNRAAAYSFYASGCTSSQAPTRWTSFRVMSARLTILAVLPCCFRGFRSLPFSLPSAIKNGWRWRTGYLQPQRRSCWC